MENKFHTNSISVSAILGLIEDNAIAIPEIQRPFVWKRTQVRDLLDSLYKGYPTGYLIIWNNPDVKLKDGTIAVGKKIIIDGQQRITALMTALKRKEIVNSKFKKERIKIAFNPFAALSEDSDAEIFAVQDSSHVKSKRWIEDISIVFDNDFSSYKFIKQYCETNPEMDEEEFDKVLTKLKSIKNSQLGIIELSKDIDIDIVTDIFIRINSKGTELSQGDFVMSKIASDEKYGGNALRKIIDYFAHLCVESQYYNYIKENDSEFANSEYFRKIAWLKDDKEDVYDPNCDDVIRIAFMHMFGRSKLAELVKSLSGRDFDAKEYRESVTQETYEKLTEGVMNVINEYNFKQFMECIKGVGFKAPKLVRSQMALDFAYTIYLILAKKKSIDDLNSSEIKRTVQKWYVLSVLTGRYTSSPESAFYADLKSISEKGVVSTLNDIEAAVISDAFWNVKLEQDLNTTSTINPTYLVYLAAQISNNELSLLSNNIRVPDLIYSGEVHHIFPKAYLRKHGYDKNMYNQLGNYVYISASINKDISDRAPGEYFKDAIEQCSDGKMRVGTITDMDTLAENLKINCIPLMVCKADCAQYEEFIAERRKNMVKKIKDYYYSI